MKSGMEALTNGGHSLVDSDNVISDSCASNITPPSIVSIVSDDLKEVSNSDEVIAVEESDEEEEPGQSEPASKRIFCCPKCKFSSCWKSSLHVHLKHQHSDARPWRCHMCRKGFKLKHHLKIHLYTHSTVKPYACNICTYSTTSERSMRNHTYNKHAKHMAHSTRPVNMEQLTTMIRIQSGARAIRGGRGVRIGSGLVTSSRGGGASSSIPSSRGEASNISLNLDASAADQNSNNSQTDYQADLLGNNRVYIPRSQQRKRSRIITSMDRAGTFMSSAPTMVQQSFNFSDVVTPAVNDESMNGESMNRGRSHTPPSLIIDSSASSSPPAPLDKYAPFPTSQPRSSGSSAHRGDDSYMSSPPPTSGRKETGEKEVMMSPVAGSGSSIHGGLETDAAQWQCKHCMIIFPDNILYGLHMGCHAHSHPYECNTCGKRCANKYDFMFHFNDGKHEAMTESNDG